VEGVEKSLKRDGGGLGVAWGDTSAGHMARHGRKTIIIVVIHFEGALMASGR
jgi:hypothetical protein